MIQNCKILVIFICLQAKLLQLFQEYKALFEIFFFFFWQSFEKSLKAFTQKGENRKLNTVANMVAKIDIDALKIF